MDIKEEYIKNYLLNFGMSFPETEVQELISYFNVKTYKKNEYLVNSGDLNPRFGFILEGLAKVTLNTFDGKEYIQSFRKENDIVFEYNSGLLKEPSAFAIKAIEPITFLSASYSDIESLYNKDRSWERLGRFILQESFLYKYSREKELLMFDAKDRYLRFKEANEELFSRISQQEIAMFIGVNPSTLNRLIKSKDL
jgi:CRP-like cAMP-binding protein